MGWQPPPSGPLARLRRVLGATAPLGRVAGVAVRIYVLTIPLMLLLFAISLGRWGIPAVEVATLAVLFTGSLYVVVLTHELGHVLAARRHGVRSHQITLSPLGGLAHLETGTPGPREERLVALAGPAVHLPWLLLLAWPAHAWEPGLARPAGWWIDPAFETIGFLWQLNLVLLLFNLLPFLPLDGGRVLRATLAGRMHANRATLIAARIGMVGGVVIAIAGFFVADLLGVLLVAIGITNFLACRREIVLARHQASPYGGERREAWQPDPDAWKAGGEGTADAVPAGPSRRERRAARRAEAEAQRRAALEAELDRVLARVSEVGMDGLSRREREILDAASRARRDEG